MDVDDYKEFSKRANRAVSLIYGSITPALQAYVGGITDAALMWTKLCATMDIVQNEGSTFMRDKFHYETFLPQDTIDQYISRILTYQERLANIRQKLSDDDVITKLLTALPPSYHITARPGKEQFDTAVKAAIQRKGLPHVGRQLLRSQTASAWVTEAKELFC